MTSSIFGSTVLRSEDPRFLRGAGRYVENLSAEEVLRAVFVRSMMPHARIEGVDPREARAMPGVVGVFTASDLALAPISAGGVLDPAFARPVLAADRARFAGEPVAVLVAETAAQAQDAAEVVEVRYDPLEAVVDPERALATGAPLLFPEHGSNLAHGFEGGLEGGDPLEGADVVARGRFVNQRLAPVPMEADAALVLPGEPAGGLTMWVSTQVPFDVRTDLAEALGLDEHRVRVVAPDVGGGFGAKIGIYPEHLALAAVARRLERPVRWSQGRSEAMTALTHGRAQIQGVEIGARRDGTIVGLRAEVLADLGAYPGHGVFLPPLTHQMSSGVYRIPRIGFVGRCVVTNTTPVGPYRGAGRPEATALVERAVDLLAAELGMDPVEVRRRNLIPPDAFPHTTAAGATYDSGDYAAALDLALELADYEGLRKEQVERRERGDRVQLGIGVSAYVEVTGVSLREFGSVEVHEDGTATVLAGVSPHGQGHETAFAQLAAGTLGVPFGRVRVVHSDTAMVPRGGGTYGSRSLQVGGSAVLEAAEALAEKARRIAAHVLEASVEDVEIDANGRIGVVGAPDRAITWSELADAAADPVSLPEGLEPGLSASTTFRQKASTYPFGVHVSVVDVDVETGDARVVRHVAVDDCGRIVNPALVEGQVHGGLGQGIAQALYEEMVYDERGTPLTSNLATYVMPSAAELPSYETAHTQTRTPLNPLGAKGIGESATVGSTPAVQNAVIDALSHLGVRHLDMPLTPERVWRVVQDASEAFDLPSPLAGAG